MICFFCSALAFLCLQIDREVRLLNAARDPLLGHFKRLPIENARLLIVLGLDQEGSENCSCRDKVDFSCTPSGVLFGAMPSQTMPGSFASNPTARFSNRWPGKDLRRRGIRFCTSPDRAEIQRYTCPRSAWPRSAPAQPRLAEYAGRFHGCPAPRGSAGCNCIDAERPQPRPRRIATERRSNLLSTSTGDHDGRGIGFTHLQTKYPNRSSTCRRCPAPK